MRRLPYEGRYQPAFEAELSELISSAKFVPFTDGVPDREGSLLHLSTYAMADGYGGWFYAAPTAELTEFVAERSIYGIEGGPGWKHGLELFARRDGSICLFMCLDGISGSYCVAVVDRLEVDHLLAAAVEQHKNSLQ